MVIFLAVVDQGSFSAAGRALGHTPSSVGKRIGSLEARLGVDLFVRSTRTMALTDAGRRYAEDARDIAGRIAALEDDLKDGAATLRGTVRMTAPTAFGQRFVVPLITEFMAQHPGTEIECTLTDKVVDLVGEGVDLAVRTGVQRDSTLRMRRIGPYLRTICAAPRYLATHGTPEVAQDLTGHKCLTLPHEVTLSHWNLGGNEGKNARLGGGLSCNSLDALAFACGQGRGIACLPNFLADARLASGRLISILPNAARARPASDIVLLRPDTQITARRVRALGDALFNGLRQSVGGAHTAPGDADQARRS